MPFPWAAAIPAAASVATGLLGYKGQRDANQANIAEAARDRNFQQMMRNTQWQATVEDMRAAGINPALAYSMGPNAGLGGSRSAPVESAVSSGMQAAQVGKTLDLMSEQISKTKAEGRKADAEADVARGRADYLTKRSELTLRDSSGRVLGTGSGRSLLEDLIDAEVDAATLGAEGIKVNTARNQALTDIAMPMADLSKRLGEVLPILGLVGAGAGGAANVLSKFSRRRKRGR